jgi:hypothetical protein
MKISIDLEILQKYISESELAAILESVRITRKNYMRGYRKRVRITRKNYKSDVRITDSETCEIGSKTAFSAENAANFALVRGGGEGGVGPNTGTLSENTVTSLHFNKEKNFRENDKKTKEQKLSEWKELEKIARPYWMVMPPECRKKSTFREFAVAAGKLRKGKDIAELWAFFGTLKKKMEAWNEGFFPAAHKFLANEPWRDLTHKEVNELSGRKTEYQRQADKIIAEFDGMGGIE